MGIHSQSKHKYRNVFGDLNIQYQDFNNGDALTFKDKYTALLQQDLQTVLVFTQSYHNQKLPNIFRNGC